MDRRTFIVSGLGLIATSLSACANQSQAGKSPVASPVSASTPELSASATTSTTMRCALGKPHSIDPAAVCDGAGLAVVYQLFDSLTDFNDKGEPYGLCASSWDVNETGTEYKFKLRQGIVFHGGEAVVAESFVAAWNRLASPRKDGTAWPNAHRLKLVQGFEDVAAGKEDSLSGLSAPDSYTLAVQLTEPCFDFASRVAHPSLAPIPTKADLSTFSLFPEGNGPFFLREAWDEASDLELWANSSYYGGSSSFGRVTFNVGDESSSWSSFQEGEVDLCSIPLDRVAAAMMEYGRSSSGYHAKAGERVLTGETLNRIELKVNSSATPLNNVHIRHAVSLAIDRARLCEVDLAGSAVAARGVVSSLVLGDYAQEASWPDVRHDAAAAQSILDQYAPVRNGSRGIHLTLTCEKSTQTASAVDGLIADLVSVGIAVTAEKVSAEELASRVATKNYELLLTEEFVAAPTWDACLAETYEERSVGDKSLLGQAVVRACSEKDDKERVKRFVEVNALASQDMPVIPLAFTRLNMVAGERVTDLLVNERALPSLVTASVSG